MKLNTLFLIPFLILSIKTEIDLDSYSIDAFIEYEKDNGLFEIIKSIKMVYGQDIAIISCEELNGNYKGNCQRLVTEYMNKFSGGIMSNDPKLKREPLKCIEISKYFRILEQSYRNSDIERKIKSKFNKNQLKSIYVKIMSRVRKLELCKE